MQPDREKYPDIPPGAQLSFNAKTGTYQVFREYYVKDSEGKSKKKKDSIGVINREGKFSFSKYYAACQEIERLKQQLKEAKAEEKQKTSTQTRQMESIRKIVQDGCEKHQLDKRQKHKVLFPLDALVTMSLLCALKGDSDCVSFSDYYQTHFNWLQSHLLEEDAPKSISHDTFYKQLLMIEAKKFEGFYAELAKQLISLKRDRLRVIACDGQAVRATGRASRDHPNIHNIRYFMNIYDTADQLCLCHSYIPAKKNEISVGPKLLEGLDIKDAIVTADALNTQVGFVEAILKAGARYCLAVKENQSKTYEEIRYLFNGIHRDHIVRHEYDWEIDHGRVEKRTVEALPAKFLSPKIKDKWPQLEQGTVLKVACDRTVKVSGIQSYDVRYYICSLPINQYSIDKLGNIVRQHWAVENKLHYVMDVNFSQDRISSNNTNYLANRTSLNNLAAAIIYRYQEYLEQCGQEISFRQIQCRMANPKYALEALCVALDLKI